MIDKSVNLSWSIEVRNQIFIRRMVENDRSHVAELMGIVGASLRSLNKCCTFSI